jgi:hypothetical protein
MRRGAIILQLALSSSSALGVVTLGPEAGVTSLRGDGVERINSRLSDTDVMTIANSHDVALGWGISAHWFNKTLLRTGGLSIAHSSDSIRAKGIGASAQSDLTSLSLLAGYQMRLFPFSTTTVTPLSNGWSGRHIFVLGGPLFGLGQIAHSYTLESRLDDTEIAYTARSIHGTGGAELSVGYLLSNQIQLLISGRATYSLPLHTESSVSSFRVRQEDLRFRASELEVDKLTGSTLQTWSASAGIQVGI